MDIVKSYFIISLIFILASYILPNAAYRKYIKYFIGIMMSVMMLKSINSMLNADTKDIYISQWKDIENKINNFEYSQSGEEAKWFEDYVRQKVEEN